MNRVHVNKRKLKIAGLFLFSRIAYWSIILASGSSIRAVCTLWDNEHYIAIAQNGYSNIFQTAFFPFIPLIIRFLGKKGLLLINQVAFLISMFILDELTYHEEKDFYVMEFFAFSPIGFFTMMLYTESLLFFFTLLAYYLFVKRKFGYGLGIIIGLGVATKSIGAMLFFAIFIGMCCLWYQEKVCFINIIKTYIPAIIISCLYPFYLQITFGNWKLFLDCQYDYWCRMKTNILEEFIIQCKVIFSNNQDILFIFRINEMISFLMVGFILYGLYRCFVLIKEKKYNRINLLVMILLYKCANKVWSRRWIGIR